MDGDPLAVWCTEAVGPVARLLFRSGNLSRVRGYRLADGREVVVKARPMQPRVAACVAVQRALWRAGFPCPEPLAGPVDRGGTTLTAERLVGGGQQLAAGADRPRLFADLLARLVAAAPAPASVPALDPPPPWLDWDHGRGGLWPVPDEPVGDLDRIPGPAWLDEAAARARRQLLACTDPPVVGHGDFESQNVRWLDAAVLVVHDWDSVVALPEAVIAGCAAAVFTAGGGTGAASVAQSAAFLTAYARSRASLPITWTRTAWAAGLWTRAFNAKKLVARGMDPAGELTPAEADARLGLAGV